MFTGDVLDLLRLVDDELTRAVSSVLLSDCGDIELVCDDDDVGGVNWADDGIAGVFGGVDVVVVIAVTGADVVDEAGGGVVVVAAFGIVVVVVVVVVVFVVIGDGPIEFSILTVDGMATKVILVGCRDILNVLNLLSGSNTTLIMSSKYELSRCRCRAHNCMNLMHEFNIQ